MRLTRYTDYCLRVLIYLGVKQDELSTIKEIADRYGISKNHLMKVVYELNQRGHVETIRGKNGGMRLGRPPSEINLGGLIRETENDMALVECFAAGNECRLTPSCVLKSVIYEALQAFLAVLDRYTLQDLLGPKRELAELLAIPVEIPRRDGA